VRARATAVFRVPSGDGKLPGLRNEDGGAVEAPRLEVSQGAVRRVERVLVRGDRQLARAPMSWARP